LVLTPLLDILVSSNYYQPVDKSNEPRYREKLTVIHNENLQTYSKRQMKVSLADYDVNLGLFRIARFMKQAGITSRFLKTALLSNRNKKPNIPNELKGQFNPPQVNTHWSVILHTSVITNDGAI
jgi:hypothetical protein